MLITKPYHLEVINNIIRHQIYKDVPVFGLVKLVKILFPEYRDKEVEKQLIDQIDQMCLANGK